MSTVILTIGPKSYPVACADGEEAHIAALGAMIAEKYALLGASRAPLEAQNLVFAALFLADELTEARKRAAAASETIQTPAIDSDLAAELNATIAQLEAELVAARKAETPAPPAPNTQPHPQTDLFADIDPSGSLAEQLEALAARTEASAAALEAAAASA